MSEVSGSAEQIQSAKQDHEIIQIRNMHKWFGDFHVLKNINLTVNNQERIVVRDAFAWKSEEFNNWKTTWKTGS